uniref:replication protein A 70 kDa DNA-binding subunit B-like n=1 Tax=Erigeron canadensis TaxID=72917 RepID=UPI001CB89082|nr:replication protein A 70 kDa DNA-binding subunit B-like [Erigeron canadensis]
MALKLLKDIKYPDYPEMIEVRVVNKWHSRNNSQQFSYLFVDITGYAIEAQAFSIDETHLDKVVTLNQCYRITKYTTRKGRKYAPLVTNDKIPDYYFNFVPFEKLKDHDTKGSALLDYVGRAESITDMIPTIATKTGDPLHLRRVMIMDDRSRTTEVTLWEDKGRKVEKAIALHQIVAVTAVFASEFQPEIVQLTSTDATKFFVNPPIPNLDHLKERFANIAHTRVGPTQNIVPLASTQKIVIRDLPTKAQSKFNRVPLSCEATITDIFAYRSWYYPACQYCSHGVNQEMNRQGEILWRCRTHATMDKPTNLYALNTLITDETGSTDAIFFNRAVEQLTSILCHELVTTENCIDPKVLPQQIRKLYGQRHMLQLTVKTDGTVHVNNILEANAPLSLK